jgi:1-phosphatidylinositol phosphodiesterase
LLSTGLTTPGFNSAYPDFPRSSCFIGICAILFQGINKLGYALLSNSTIKYYGISLVYFYGDDLLKLYINSNFQLFGTCSISQLRAGCNLCSPASVCLGCNTVRKF